MQSKNQKANFKTTLNAEEILSSKKSCREVLFDVNEISILVAYHARISVVTNKIYCALIATSHISNGGDLSSGEIYMALSGIRCSYIADSERF